MYSCYGPLPPPLATHLLSISGTSVKIPPEIYRLISYDSIHVRMCHSSQIPLSSKGPLYICVFLVLQQGRHLSKSIICKVLYW